MMIKNLKFQIVSFFDIVSKTNELIYLLLLSLYVTINVEIRISFTPMASNIVEKARYVCLGIVMWGTALYLLNIIATWKRLWANSLALIFAAILLLSVTGYFASKMSTNSFGVVFDFIFAVLACGKSFRKMLQCILGVVTMCLVLAGIGVPLGYTIDVGKPDTNTPGHGLGINYPNTWGYLLFLNLIIIWYLYLRYKPILTFSIFWVCALLCSLYIRCRTIASLCIIFPLLSFAVDNLEQRADKITVSGLTKKHRIIKMIVIAIPFLSLAFMLVLSSQTEWLYKNFYYTYLHNLADRFLMGGLYFKHWGMPLFGNPYRSDVYIYENVCGEFLNVGILDSSFAAYIIMRGLFWLGYTLMWLCLAHWKALRNRDYAIPFLELILLVFAMIPGLCLGGDGVITATTL